MYSASEFVAALVFALAAFVALALLAKHTPDPVARVLKWVGRLTLVAGMVGIPLFVALVIELPAHHLALVVIDLVIAAGLATPIAALVYSDMRIWLLDRKRSRST